MESQRLLNWIQVITGLAVLLGLALVVWELQQTRTLARVQLYSDSMNAKTDFTAALLGEEPMSVIGKACLEPDSLTLEDASVLLRYFRSLEERIYVQYQLGVIGGLSEPLGRDAGQGLEQLSEQQIMAGLLTRELIATEIGQAWLSGHIESWPDDMKPMGKHFLERRKQGPPCRESLESLIELTDQS